MEFERERIVLKLKKEDGSNFTLDELIFVLKTTKTGLEDYYLSNGVNKKELKRLSPEIIHAEDGCIQIIVAVSIILGTAFLTGFANAIGEKVGVAFLDKTIEIIKPKKRISKWTSDEELQVADLIVKEIVLTGNDPSLNDLLKKLSNGSLNKRHSRSSLEKKIRNSIFVLNELRVAHNSSIQPLSNHSKANKKALINVLKANDIKFK